MKKNIFAGSLILLVLAVALLFPVTKNITIDINANFENTFREVMNIERWKDWYPEIRNSYDSDSLKYQLIKKTPGNKTVISIPGKKITIEVLSPMSYHVTDSGKQTQNFAFTIFPTEKQGKMKVFVTKKVPLIAGLFSTNDLANQSLQGLKTYLETPKDLYGYDIQMSQIKDPLIASHVFKTSRTTVFNELAKVRTRLMDYVTSNGLQKTGVVSVSYIPMMHDSLQITVGIPVNKTAPPHNGIECLELPATGRVLTADFTGTFKNRNRIYGAMTKYLTDHTLSVPAESFERYLNDSLPKSDSDQIRIQLNYPVY